MPSFGAAFNQQYTLALLEFWNLGTSSVCVCWEGGFQRHTLGSGVPGKPETPPPPHRAAVLGEGDLLPLRGISAMNISAYKNLWPKSRNSDSDS